VQTVNRKHKELSKETRQEWLAESREQQKKIFPRQKSVYYMPQK